MNVSLIDAVHDDVAAAYTFKQKIKGYISGTYTGGNGRSLINLADISNSKQQHRSINLSKSLNKSEDCPFFVDPEATNREDTICDVSTGVVALFPYLCSKGDIPWPILISILNRWVQYLGVWIGPTLGVPKWTIHHWAADIWLKCHHMICHVL